MSELVSKANRLKLELRSSREILRKKMSEQESIAKKMQLDGQQRMLRETIGELRRLGENTFEYELAATPSGPLIEKAQQLHKEWLKELKKDQEQWGYFEKEKIAKRKKALIQERNAVLEELERRGFPIETVIPPEIPGKRRKP